jgi:hypothetical protein
MKSQKTSSLVVAEGPRAPKGFAYDINTGAFILEIDKALPKTKGHKKHEPFKHDDCNDHLSLALDLEGAKETIGKSIDDFAYCNAGGYVAQKTKPSFFSWQMKALEQMKGAFRAQDDRAFLNSPFNKAWARAQYDSVIEEAPKRAKIEPLAPPQKSPLAQAQEALNKMLSRLNEHKIKGYSSPKAQRLQPHLQGLFAARDKAYNEQKEARDKSLGLDKAWASFNKELEEGLIDLKAWQKKHKRPPQGKGLNILQSFTQHIVGLDVDLWAFLGAPYNSQEAPPLRALELNQIHTRALKGFDVETKSFIDSKELDMFMASCPAKVAINTWYRPLLNRAYNEEGLEEGSFHAFGYIQKIESFKAFNLQIVRVFSREKGSFYCNEEGPRSKGLEPSPYCPWGPSSKKALTLEEAQAQAQELMQRARAAKGAKLLKRAKGSKGLAQAKPITKKAPKAQEAPKPPKAPKGPQMKLGNRKRDQSNEVIFFGLQAKPSFPKAKSPQGLIVGQGPKIEGASKDDIRALIMSLRPPKAQA